MDRDTVTYTQMGGEGATWIGQAPFTDTAHVFQNIGDGTYAHSGILAIRAAVAAGVNITYKVLYNDAVAMTGGQTVEGNLTVARVARQLTAEGVTPIMIVSDAPEKHRQRSGLPEAVTVHNRRALDRLQRELRDLKGVSALIYDQTCAAELHRDRKRGRQPYPNRRVVINEYVCEGCGDCNKQSNCLSVMAHETPLGRKRRINQSSCNQDFSCLEGFCPSFVTLEGASRNPVMPLAGEEIPELPEPEPAPLGSVYNILIAGIGGTGVVTASGLLGLAAHLEGRIVLQLDQTGLAQKFGAVLSHVRIAPDREHVHGMRIPAGQVDLLFGADLMVAADTESLSMLSADRSAVVVNTHEEMPPSFIRHPDMQFPSQRLLHELRTHSRSGRMSTLDATRLASALLGDSIAANVFILGFVFQRGLLPLTSESLYRALELYGVNVETNKRTFDWGRYTAERPDDVAAKAAGDGVPTPALETLREIVDYRYSFLEAYQDRAYADRYRDRVNAIRDLERRMTGAPGELSEEVARNYFRLLAYKDEYEVARLYTRTDFLGLLSKNFGNDFRLRFHFSPPLVAARDTETGRPRKYEFGGWVVPLLRALAHLRHLRGTRWDIFGYTKERRMERRLIADYEAALAEIEGVLNPENLEHAERIVALPVMVKGFGPLKLAAVRRYDELLQAGLERFRASGNAQGESAERASAA